MSTNVPSSTFGASGLITPQESDILAGVQADINAAFGGNLNSQLTTPQGQMAQTLAAIIGNANDNFLSLVNGVDPAFSSGRMQDGIGRLYFMTRIPAQGTVVSATVMGAAGVVIPVGAQAADVYGNRYICTSAVTIPSGGSIDTTFESVEKGPIACPAGALNKIYVAIPGWDTITNAQAGVLGRLVESRADFEYRRQQSVALNSVSPLQSVLSSVLSVDGVVSAYVTDNSTSTQSGAAFTGSIAGTLLTASGVTSGSIRAGHLLTGANVVPGTMIVAPVSGTGGNGTYTISINQSAASSAMQSAPGGVMLPANSLYVGVYGGNAQDIAKAIWKKKIPGCSYSGSTTVTVYDTSSYYSAPFPAYDVSFTQASAVAVKFTVSMQLNNAIPSDAAAQVRNAIIAAFSGADGGARERIGGQIFASKYYGAIASLGTWAKIYSVTLGTSNSQMSGLTSLLLPMNVMPVCSTSDIVVSFV